MDSKSMAYTKVASAPAAESLAEPNKEPATVFYEGQSKMKRAGSARHSFYDPTQGGFTKRWTPPRG